MVHPRLFGIIPARQPRPGLGLAPTLARNMTDDMPVDNPETNQNGNFSVTVRPMPGAVRAIAG